MKLKEELSAHAQLLNSFKLVWILQPLPSSWSQKLVACFGVEEEYFGPIIDPWNNTFFHNVETLDHIKQILTSERSFGHYIKKILASQISYTDSINR